ncbi:MAG: hypothetical protein O2910_02850, partial [Proteobacteria bacterium]|nr:hypothetical protein [Pseudomonadota bacterium]
MLRKILWGAMTLVIVVAGFGAWTLWNMGAFVTVESEFAGTCKQIEGTPGPEDVTIDHKTGIAYISSNDWEATDRNLGAIYGYDLNDPDATPINLTPTATAEFRPHGISLWRGDAGPGRLVVISHPIRDGQKQHEIVVFEVLGFALRQVNIITDPAPEDPYFLTSP